MDLSAEEIVRQALTDTLYYRFDKWFDLFDKKIALLEAAPNTLENRLDRIRYYFYYAGLVGEICHTLAFTSKYKIEEVENKFLRYSIRARELAREILDDPNLTDDQRARGYLYLGASEGYIAIFQYGGGHLFSALINGFQADNHLEKALSLGPNQTDAHFGLGIYRYGNSRLGGIGNFLMQGGRDLRQVGLQHIEQAIRDAAPSKPLAMKTLIWFYISEQINPDNLELPSDHPLSPAISRLRALQLMAAMEKQYFDNPPYKDFKGNKELALMQAIQKILDNDYSAARDRFEKVLEICDQLIGRGFAINPQLIDTVKAGIEFSDLMLMSPADGADDGGRSVCLKIDDQLIFLNSGGTLVEYDSKKIRRELHTVFANALNGLSKKMNCS